MENLQLTLPLDLPPSFSAQDFVVGTSNKEAFLWVERWPNWPNQGLVIYGEKGCGKSHLGQIWLQHSGATFLSGATFSKANLTPELFTHTHFLLDHGDKIGDEEALFHLYNHVKNIHGSLLILSEMAPAYWDLTLPDLRSRMNAIPSTPVGAPDDDLLAAIFLKLFEDQQLTVTPEIIRYLTIHGERSFASAKDLVQKINHASLSLQRRITLPLVRTVLLQENMSRT